MPPWDPHRAGSHTNPTCSRRPLLHTARDFEVLRGVPGWHDHAESKRPLKLAPTRRQLPRDISRRSRAREHDLRARIVAPELAQPTRSIRWRGGGDWAGYPRSISPIAAETRRAPLPELCSTTGRRSASPAAYRATSGVDAPCCAGCEVLRQRTAVASFCTKKVNRSVRLQHGRARARMSERARVIAPQASGMGSSPGTSSPRGIPCREPWYWTALQPQPANSTERSRVGQRCPGWAAWLAGVVRWPRRTQAPPSGPSKSRAALRGIKYFIRGF